MYFLELRENVDSGGEGAGEGVKSNLVPKLPREKPWERGWVKRRGRGRGWGWCEGGLGLGLGFNCRKCLFCAPCSSNVKRGLLFYATLIVSLLGAGRFSPP